MLVMRRGMTGHVIHAVVRHVESHIAWRRICLGQTRLGRKCAAQLMHEHQGETENQYSNPPKQWLIRRRHGFEILLLR